MQTLNAHADKSIKENFDGSIKNAEDQVDSFLKMFGHLVKFHSKNDIAKNIITLNHICAESEFYDTLSEHQREDISFMLYQLNRLVDLFDELPTQK